MNDPQMHYITWERPDSKGYTQLDFTCITSFWKGQNHEDRKHLSGVQALWVEEITYFGEAWGNVSRWQNFMYRLQWLLHECMHLSDFIECTLSGVIEIEIFFFLFLFFKLWQYDNTFTGDLENTEQNYIYW